ncbi:MAG: thiamine biosynthesis protein ThiS [Sedimenticola sp.]|jgi:sulfur carrier protein|nr:MAG: thiamine biosynthesis protein ThiS [Sedimenticola sp.]
MQIYINGEQKQVSDNLIMSDLIEMLELTGQRIAVEINEELVPRSTFSSHQLSEGDQVEIVNAIGGG